ncbi:MAG: hypothetical protein LIO87_09190 [Eubacterium sp.]|nr:hypothetical protein [Eubacterium sp.]
MTIKELNTSQSPTATAPLKGSLKAGLRDDEEGKSMTYIEKLREALPNVNEETVIWNLCPLDVFGAPEPGQYLNNCLDRRKLRCAECWEREFEE